MDLGTAFDASVARQPGALAFVDGELRRDFASWQKEIRCVAGGLSAMGLQADDRLVCIMANRYEMATLYWACQMLGAVFTPFNWRATTNDIAFILEDADPQIVAFDDSCDEAVQSALGGFNFSEDALVTAGVDLPGIAFAKLLKSDPVNSPVGARDEDICLMLYTSGTTGKPKGVPRSHRAERTAAASVIAHLRYRFGDCALGVMPLFHTMGIRILLCSMMINGALINMRGFNGAAALKLIEDENINSLFLVPTMFHDMLAQETFATDAMSSVQNIAYAGMSMTSELEQRCVERFQPEIFANYYGSSEIFTFSVCDHLDRKPGSAGWPGINQKIRVVRADADGGAMPNETLSPNEIGEVIATMESPEAFRGYWKRPDADEKAIRDGWYFTGDLGYFDEDGELFLAGRIDDMIISGGENIHPEEVEDTLSDCDLVSTAAVVGLPDERWGQKVVAFIEAASEKAGAKALDEFCTNSALARFKRPKAYVFVEALPKSASGKLLRRHLRDGDYVVSPKFDSTLQELDSKEREE
ncbi:MAG: 4-chlorobenzoate--CoA ligase [Rhodospirillaceae bacterium]|nr:4-chlorobenzoate--CoA ligase [Rhodospirillaceae bacterium]|tara:strand:+ start:11428 stop:13014 length:1587 start_codon:yes stop_codon:yes gene_type:complete